MGKLLKMMPLLWVKKTIDLSPDIFHIHILWISETDIHISSTTKNPRAHCDWQVHVFDNLGWIAKDAFRLFTPCETDEVWHVSLSGRLSCLNFTLMDRRRMFELFLQGFVNNSFFLVKIPVVDTNSNRHFSWACVPQLSCV